MSIGHVCSAILAALWYSYIHLDIQSLAVLPHMHMPCAPLMPFLILDLSSHGTFMWMGRLSFACIFKSLFSSQFPQHSFTHRSTFRITQCKNGPSFSVVRLSHEMTKITMCSCEDLEKPFSGRVAK